MNYNDALKTVELVILSGEVPLIIGESGIGKTSLVRQLCMEKEYHLITIDANLLKEGEIGGLPTVYDKEYIIDGERISKKSTIYATHHKLIEIDEILSDDSGKEVLLFIDELNRCEHAVQQELMNLILNREINGYELSEKVHVVAAMNPSNKYDNFETTDYQVVDMDTAQEDRFVWIEMDSDFKGWLRWAMSSGKVDETVIEFLSTFPEYLHTPDSKESIKATPRSWERVSKSYKVYLSRKSVVPQEIFYNVVKGNVGVSIAQDFISFINNVKEPILKAKDILENDVLTYEIKEIIKNESHSRLYIIAKNCLTYLEDKKDRSKSIEVFASLIKEYPKDLRFGVMKEIKSDHSKELYEEILDSEVFIEAFFDIYS
ncbi:AAA domain (dynein-related subfamily) [Clostridium cavendishii DSM 21758]|uniref:AAA domain (Dynein-related subfamily) n=1 Tax=Clostridium cavendishii DSM 21758 TaxID=1121302 RepID=A0A1M6Q3H8_9CLOT|nr:AAA family ATPase [Clostridium cavendishii]SHK14657.1 AAA domain (dynein-related subfamily) [Clostridium cavendishii DSM 21758]